MQEPESKENNLLHQKHSSINTSTLEQTADKMDNEEQTQSPVVALLDSNDVVDHPQ